MNKLLKYSLFLLISVFAACSSEDEVVPPVPPVQPQSGDVLELTVSAGDFVTDAAPDTRATDNGGTTTFESGDRVGVIILNEDGQPIYNNIPYKYNSNKWVFDSSNGEGKDICYYDSQARTYIVYYPYHKDADGCTSESDLKAKFVPQSDQSTKDNYRASDLMVCTTTSGTPLKSLAAELKHAYASVYLTPVVGKYILEDGTSYTGSYVPKVSDVNLTIGDMFYAPYQTADGYFRCIVPVGTTPNNIRCFYTAGGKTYGNIISGAVVANTRYTCAPAIGDVTYSLDDAHVGDFYCKNSKNEGYLIPGDVASLSKDQKDSCLGIVMKVGKDDAGSWKDDCNYKCKNNITPMSTIHGYVLALYDVNGGGTCQWGSRLQSIGTNTETIGFYGYKNTQTIIDNDKKRGSNLLVNFPATYYATKNYESNYSAPTNSSGWFLPSTGQGKCWLNNRTTLLSQVKKAMGDDSYHWKDYYWLSSESIVTLAPFWSAWFVSFNSGYVEGGDRDNFCSVRSCLAF